MKTQRSSQDSILALTGLRAVACFLVMLCHCTMHGYGEVEAFGHAGIPAVYLFFVLSGYLLMRSGLFQIQSSFDGVPQRFRNLKLISYLIRRFMRIYPAYVITILIYKAMVWHIRVGGYKDSLLIQYDRSVWQSLYFFGMESHFWTMKVEMIFFLAFLPIILVITAELKVLDHQYLRNSRYQSTYFFYLITTILISCKQYENRMWNGGIAFQWRFFVHLPGFWHGCLGGIASHYFNLNKMKGKPINNWIVELITWGIVLRLALGNHRIARAYTNLDPNSYWNGTFLQTPFKAALIFILEFKGETNSIARTLSLPLFQYLGKISYSTYLMHMFVLIVFKLFTVVRGVEGTFEMMTLSCFAGAILYHVIEARGVKYGEEFIRQLQSSSKNYSGNKSIRGLERTKDASNEVVQSEIELKTD